MSDVTHLLNAIEQGDPTAAEHLLPLVYAELRRQAIHGKAVTPFLLAHFTRATGGASLQVNKQVVRHNARLAARIARAQSSPPAL